MTYGLVPVPAPGVANHCSRAPPCVEEQFWVKESLRESRDSLFLFLVGPNVFKKNWRSQSVQSSFHVKSCQFSPHRSASRQSVRHKQNLWLSPERTVSDVTAALPPVFLYKEKITQANSPQGADKYRPVNHYIWWSVWATAYTRWAVEGWDVCEFMCWRWVEADGQRRRRRSLGFSTQILVVWKEKSD